MVVSLQAFFDNFALIADAPNGISKLRELILGLAFRGKLVPQFPEEGTASMLVEEIESVKAKLQRECNTPKTTRFPSINEDEKQHKIPTTWQWARLGDVVAYDCSQKVTAKQIPADAWLLELEDIEKDSSRIIQRCKYSERQSKSIKARFVIGDVLYGKLRPYLNKVVVADANGYCTTEIVTLRGYHGVDPKYLMYALKRPEFIAYINEKSYGTKMPRLGSTDARLSVIPLPPLKEQKRIVVKVDELMRLCDVLEERRRARRESRERLNNAMVAPLNKAASLKPEEFKQATSRLTDNFDKLYDSLHTISKLRSTILQLAVQGKLVPQAPEDQSASDFLRKLREIEAVSFNKGPENQVIDTPIQFPIPRSWTWVRLGYLLKNLRYGTSKACSYLEQGSPVLRIPNIELGEVSLSDLKYTALRQSEEDALKLEEGDLLMIRSNGSSSLVGRTAVVRQSAVGYAYAGYLVRLRPLTGLNSDYLHLVCESALVRCQIELPIRTTSGVKNINSTEISNLWLPLPPRAEQKRIVAKVNQLMSLCDGLEAKLRQAEADSEKLMNAAVQHVFTTISQKSATQSDLEQPALLC